MVNYWDGVAENKYYYFGDNYEGSPRNLPLKMINDGESILDIGCGNGFLYQLIKDSGRPITYSGIDYSEVMINNCKERFPEADFQVKDATELNNYAENSYDIVYIRHCLENLPDWEDAVRQMFRISRKWVIIDTRRHFTNEPSVRGEVDGTTWCWNIGYNDFNHLARTLSDNVSYLEELKGAFAGDFTDIVVIGKKMDNIVFTLDDFAVDNHNLDILLKIKEESPKMKVTLFAVPNRCPPSWLRELKEKYGDWMQFAVHGFYHFTQHGSQEANYWTKEEALKYLNRVEEEFGDLFVKGFKAPGWQMNWETYEALKEKGYWIMDGEWLSHIRPEGFTNYYETNHLWEVNGHIQETPYNGLHTIYNLKNPFTPDSNYYFIDEMIGTDRNNWRLKKICR